MGNGGYQKRRSYSCLPARRMYVMPARSGDAPSLALASTLHKASETLRLNPTCLLFRLRSYSIGSAGDFFHCFSGLLRDFPSKLTSKVDLRFAFSNEVNMPIRLSLTFLSDIVAPLFAIGAGQLVELARSPSA